MANQINNYQCPACTGPLHYEGSSGKLECEYCGSAYEVAEIEKMYAEAEKKAKEAYAQAQASGDGWDDSGFSSWGEDANGLKTYSCPSCGAELICDETTAATSCPYCGNNTIVPGQFEDTIKPDLVIPFKLNKDAAVDALKNHYKGKKLLPKSFISSNRVEEISGVYVPFWLFDGSASGETTYKAEKKRSERRGNDEDIYTEHFNVQRAGSTVFEKVPVDASSKMPSGHMDSIEPFDYAEIKEFSTAYLPGYLADKYDIDVETSAPRADLRFKNTMLSDLRDTVEGYDSVTTTSENVKLERGDVKYALFPVWMLSTKFKDETYTFAMNGQTGKMVGDLPVDKSRLFGHFAAWFAALMVIICAWTTISDGAPSWGVAFIGSLIVAGIVCFVLVSQMKSVATATSAKIYERKDAFKLSRKTDTYVNTTVEHIHHEPPKQN